MRIHQVLLIILALTMVAEPALAQWRADARAAHFTVVRARQAVPHARLPQSPPPIADDGGDLRLMFLGGLLGAAAGYLVGDAAHSGIASVLDVRGVPAADYSDYLAALPAVGSILGAAVGAGSASCVKLLFGSLYRLDSCADTRWMILGALPAAAAGYAFRDRGVAVTAGAILLEAAGAALAGRLARNERESAPVW